MTPTSQHINETTPENETTTPGEDTTPIQSQPVLVPNPTRIPWGLSLAPSMYLLLVSNFINLYGINTVLGDSNGEETDQPPTLITFTSTDPTPRSNSRRQETWRNCLRSMKISMPKRISGEEPNGILNFLTEILSTATKYKMQAEDIPRLLKARSKKNSLLHNIILSKIDDKISWQEMLVDLHSIFPNKHHEHDRIPYGAALREFNEYTGYTSERLCATSSTFEMLLNIHQLARSLTLAAQDSGTHESTYLRVRDKILTIIPMLETSVFVAENQAIRRNQDKLKKLFSNILLHHDEEITKFMEYN